MILESQPVGIGCTAVVWGLHAENLAPVGQPFVDPPTAAAFTVLRIDTLTAGETMAETGRLFKSVRVLVRNDSDAIARFRMEIKLGPNYTRMSSDLARVCERDWAAAYDAAKREGRIP